MYAKTVLENGIRVVTESIPERRSVAISILVDAGPQDEAPEQRGLAHLIEHMMFQGTSSRDAMQIARLMDMSGGQVGAFTTRDYTCYIATVLDDYCTYALDLLGDVLLNSVFAESSLEMEKGAILREIAAAQDAPRERVNTLLKASSWPDHPLGRPVAGHPETVSALTREDVIYFVHEHYLPNRIIIAAAGNVEHQDFVAQVRDAFWRMLGEGAVRQNREPVYHPGVSIEHVPVHQTYFSLGIPALPYADPKRYDLHVLNKVLGGGISSRLFLRIREERGLVYDIATEYHAYRDAGMWVIEGSTSPEFLIPVLGLTMVELWNLVSGQEMVGPEELWKAKMQLRAQHLLGSESTSTRMSRLATQELYFGRHISQEEILAQIEDVEDQRLQQLARESLQSLSQVTVAVVGPQAPEHYTQAAIEALLPS